jgi:hypothetical protein
MRIAPILLILTLGCGSAQKSVNTQEMDAVRVSATEYPWLGDANFQKMIAGKSEPMGEVVSFWQREIESGRLRDTASHAHIAGKIGPQHTPFTIDRLASLWTIALQASHGPDKLTIKGRNWTLYTQGSVLESGTY